MSKLVKGFTEKSFIKNVKIGVKNGNHHAKALADAFTMQANQINNKIKKTR
jgi:hypothetical protein